MSDTTKALHAEIAAYLDAVDAGRCDGRSRALHTLAPAQARLEFDRSSAPARADAALWVRELSIATRDGAAIAARLYTPHAVADGPAPLLLYFHGGGYTVGSLDSHDALCRSLARRAPCALLSVGYRLAPEHRFPTAIEDAIDAARWLGANSAALGIDPDRIAVGGDSAGGTIATVLAMLAARDRCALGFAPVMQLLLYPVTDAAHASASMELFEEGYLLEAETLRWFHRHYARDDADYSDWRFSPLLSDDLGGLAPAFIALAGYDPLFDEGLAYAKKLEQHGVAVQLRIYSDMTHDFLRMAHIVADIEAAHGEIAAILAKAFQTD